MTEQSLRQELLEALHPLVTNPQKFLSQVEINPHGCWRWTGHLEKGYGRFAKSPNRVRCHVAMYRAVIGDPPIGLCLDHLCRVRSCINPLHLDPVTNRENTLRGISPICHPKERCSRGHELVGQNVMMDSWGRHCRICKAITRRKVLSGD